MKKWMIGMLAVFACAACSGDDGDDDVPQYEKPQILPDNTPACVMMSDVVVGDSLKFDFPFSNRGAQALVVTHGELVDDDAGQFRYDEIRAAAGSPPCTDAQPCSIEYREGAVARFFYEPTTEGWHTANLLIYSNAENFPTLQTYVLARARPMGSDATYDYGAAPASAMGACQ